MSVVYSKDDPNYRQCTVTVMDNIADPDITFDEKGICNYYYDYLRAEKGSVFQGEAGEKKLNELVAKIKADGKNKSQMPDSHRKWDGVGAVGVS